ncbi:Rieske (2Fe-2S) protein [Streptomyces sp. LN785]|uniref:Rieske (2Fe-2S) protein n=1 Tax=Streptomyces sp. LN785 TaxID=3112983 RepID=UPI00371BB888
MDARRRTVLTAGAVGAAGLVTACGSSGGGGGTTASERSASATPSTAGKSTAVPQGSTPSGTALAKTSDVPVGGGRVFEEQKVVVTQPEAGRFKGFSAICTHAGCTVASVEDGTINCPCHGSKYSITDATVVAGPAPRPLPAEQITVSGGTIRLG